MKKFITLLVFILCVELHSVENSIMPLVDKVQKIENLQFSKYCPSQKQEILEVLLNPNDKIRLVSYNILCHINEAEWQKPENFWALRCPKVIELINEMNPDILCVQEIYRGQQDQLQDLLDGIGEKYDFYGEPCTDGEINGIFYRKDRFEVILERSWAIPKIKKPSEKEMLTQIKLKDLETNKIFSVFNFHLAFSSPEERENQAIEIAKKLRSEKNSILTGDMNLFPNRPDLTSLPFYDGDYIHKILKSHFLHDAREESLLGHLGPISTFTNGKQSATPFMGLGTPGVMLDRIYVSKGIEVTVHATQCGKVNGQFPSDHMPILIDCYIR